MRKRINKRETGVSLSDISSDTSKDTLEIGGLSEPEDIDKVEVSDTPKIPSKKKKKKSIPAIIASILISAIFIGFSSYGYIKNQEKLEVIYIEASNTFNSKNYEEAYEQFYSLGDYKDASEMADSSLEAINNGVYKEAMKLKEDGKYTEAIEKLEGIADYTDSQSQIEECKQIRRKLYIEHIGVEIYKINKYKELAVAMCDVVSKDWQAAINTGTDTTVALQKTYATWSDNTRKLNIGSEGLKKQVEEIEELEGASEAYSKMHEIYSLYVKINEQALAPTGSYVDYNKKIADYSGEFDALIERIYVVEPEIKAVVANEVRKAMEEELKQEQKVVPE